LGLFSLLGGLIGGGAAKNTSRQAQAAQLGFLNQALGQEHQQYDTTRADFAPWRTEGGTALGQQGDLLGLHGNDPQAAAIAQLQGSPLYQSLYRNGLEANLQNASATGGLRGGNEGRSLADFGSDTLAQVIQQQLGNLGSVSGQGLSAASQGAQSGDMLSQAIAQILGNQGQVSAAGILQRGGITNSMWNNAGGFLDTAASMIPGLGGFGKLF
jgi:hypothetical protein